MTKLQLASKSHFGNDRSSPAEVFIGKGVLKMYRRTYKFIGEQPCRGVIIEIINLLKSQFGMGVLL